MFRKNFTQIRRRSVVKSEFGNSEDSFQGNYGLTNREMEVFKFLIEGMTHREIAGDMNLSHHTVDTHVHNIFQKLMVHNVVDAITKFTNELVSKGPGTGFQN
jgi:DNA-binding NarL/FixJ family response regulator